MLIKRIEPFLGRKRTVQLDKIVVVLLKNPGFHNKNIAHSGGRDIFKCVLDGIPLRSLNKNKEPLAQGRAFSLTRLSALILLKVGGKIPSNPVKKSAIRTKSTLHFARIAVFR